MDHPTKPLPPHILIAEDDEDDLLLITEALVEIDNSLEFSTYSSGEHLIDRLKSDMNLPASHLPQYLLFLDLNMPGMNGWEILEQVNKLALPFFLPIIILTTSTSPSDIYKAYQEHIQGYIIKPSRFNTLQQAIATACNYWLHTVAFPKSQTS